jgi:hypothetical protein
VALALRPCATRRQNGRSSSSGLVWRRVESQPHKEQPALGLQPRHLAVEAVHTMLRPEKDVLPSSQQL